jgi:hypothetical protein
MNLGQIFKLVDFIANKDQTGDTITPDQFSDAILPAVNIMFFKKKYGLPEDYQPGQPIPRQAWELTQKMSDDLRKFKEVNPALIINSNGVASIPADYVHRSLITKTYIPYTGANPKTTTVEVLTDSEAGERRGNSITGPTIKNPFCVFQKNYIQFYPSNLQSVEFTYLRLPKTPFFDYTIANDQYIFLPAGQFHNGTVLPAGTPSRTVELEWPEETHIDFVMRIMSFVGINLREDQLINFAEQAKTSGE